MALKKLAISAAVLSVSRATQAAASFLTLPLLARLLAPEQFGLVALAMSFVLFTMAFADAGMGQSLVRTPPERREVWSSAFWMIAALSASLSVLLLVVAYPAAWVFNQPDLAPVVMALAPLPLLQGMLSPVIADLQQREKFPQQALAEFSGSAFGIVMAIVVAVNGGGAWALVGQQLAYITVKAAVLISFTRFRPQFVLSLKDLDAHIRFGRDTAGWSLINFVARQVDPLVIAKMIGASALGLYSMAYRLMSLPSYMFGGPIQNTLYTRMVRLRDDVPALRSLVLIASRAMASFLFPPMAMLAVTATPFIKVFLSERWMPMAPLLAAMAPVGGLFAVLGLNGPLLMATGRTDLRLKLSYEYTAIWIVAVLALATQGITAVAIGYSVVFLAYTPRLLQLFLQPIDGGVREYLRAISVPTLVSAGLVLAHLAATAVLPPLAPWVEMGLAVSEVLIGYGLIAWALHGRLNQDIRTLRSVLRSRETPAEAQAEAAFATQRIVAPAASRPLQEQEG
ncbi:MAG TPA: lipopolysaccharide biosynthesis protein [Hyphomonadaceae bacterium]|nr:lipopolysaccharide biosynthesis protein [Hyphomonadaceae bacterium]